MTTSRLGRWRRFRESRPATRDLNMGTFTSHAYCFGVHMDTGFWQWIWIWGLHRICSGAFVALMMLFYKQVVL